MYPFPGSVNQFELSWVPRLQLISVCIYGQINAGQVCRIVQGRQLLPGPARSRGSGGAAGQASLPLPLAAWSPNSASGGSCGCRVLPPAHEQHLCSPSPAEPRVGCPPHPQSRRQQALTEPSSGCTPGPRKRDPGSICCLPGICGAPGTCQSCTDSRPCLQRQMMTPVHPHGSSREERVDGEGGV